ncbi:HK97 family phage prohead protease [Microbacterium sp. PA5]|uniref:HK97 family phage prohead protease n=1 Tax=Microbacterium sp. PA5 TaxID=3416654 RepID=UPI003CF3D970
MKIKQLVQVKLGEAAGLEEGEFQAYASVFGNKDSYGDVVIPGAFKGTLERWASKDALIPLLFGHRMDDPDFNIGHVDAKEDDHGLWVHGYIDLETAKGSSTHRAMKAGRLNQMSFAYDVIEGAWVTKDGEEFYELRELELYEVSVVTVGANQETEIIAVKSTVDALLDGVKAGRVLSAKNEDNLRGVLDAVKTGVVKPLEDVLSQLAAGEDQEKAAGQADVKDEGAVRVKSEDVSVSPSARALAVNQYIQSF